MDILLIEETKLALSSDTKNATKVMVGQDTITDGRTILIAILSIRFGYKKKTVYLLFLEYTFLAIC